MPQIHPSAIVEESVELADDVVVGPQCIVQGRVKVGAGTKLLHRVTLHGPLTIGRGNVIYPNACIGYAPQDLKFDHDHGGAGTVIGDGNTTREGVTIHRATKDRPTTLGDRNYLMVGSHMGHDTLVGNDVTMANDAMLGGHVEVGDRAILGGNSGVHQFCRIGRLSLIGGGQTVLQDLPPFCIAHTKDVGSLNLVGLRRAGLGGHIKALKRAFDLIFRSRLAKPTAIERVLAELGDDPLCVEMADFLRHSKRGITGYSGTRGEAARVDTMDIQSG